MVDKRAIISDVHANEQALEAVLADIYRRGIKKIICAGDIVGYGAKPNECVKLIRNRIILCTLGNHDHDVLYGTDKDRVGAQEYAVKSMDWTRKVLTQRNKDFLRHSEYVLKCPLFDVVHSNPREPKEFPRYIMDEKTAEWVFEAMEKRICFFGHSHIAELFINVNGEIANEVPFKGNDGKFNIGENVQALINVGAVGQPRPKKKEDADPRASYVVYTPPNEIEYVRVEYDIEGAMKDIRLVDLPEVLARRLGQGI